MNIRFFIGFIGLLCLLVYSYRMCDENGCNFSSSGTETFENEITESSSKTLKSCNINTKRTKSCRKETTNIDFSKIKDTLESKRNINKFIDDELNFPVTSMRFVRKNRCINCGG